MTREEERKEAAKIFNASSDDYTVYKKSFEAGAEWADKHPRKGLWDSKKVCDFIASHLTDKSIINNWQLPYQTVEDFIDDLRKAMDE